MAGLTDIMMATFAMESVYLRTEKNPTDQKREMTAVFLRESMEQIEGFSRTVLSDASEGDALRRSIPARLIQAEKYMV